jgi:hypothetical protein
LKLDSVRHDAGDKRFLIAALVPESGMTSETTFANT